MSWYEPGGASEAPRQPAPEPAPPTVPPPQAEPAAGRGSGGFRFRTSPRDEPAAAKSGGMGGRKRSPILLVAVAGIVALVVVLALVFLVF